MQIHLHTSVQLRAVGLIISFFLVTQGYRRSRLERVRWQYMALCVYTVYSTAELLEDLRIPCGSSGIAVPM